jgi:transcriptional regulator with XRE-family HTH domain
MIAERIRQERQKKGWTQTFLAKKSDLSQQMIAHYESGATIALEKLEKICNALGLSIDTFKELKNQPSEK